MPWDMFLVLLQVIRDGVPQQFVSTAPLLTGTAAHVLFCTCLFSSIDTLFCSLFCVRWTRDRLQGNEHMREHHHHHHYQTGGSPRQQRTTTLRREPQRPAEAAARIRSSSKIISECIIRGCVCRWEMERCGTVWGFRPAKTEKKKGRNLRRWCLCVYT